MLHQQIEKNKQKTVIVVMMYFVLYTLIGWGIGVMALGNSLYGLMLAIIIGVVYISMMLSQSTSMVMRLNHATEVTSKQNYPMLWNIVEDMAMVAKVPMPKIYVIQDKSPNAFATGISPEKAAVAVTTGLLERLNREELEGVMAHEFAHIKNYDVRLQTIAIALGAAIAALVQLSVRLPWNESKHQSSKQDDKSTISAILMILSLIAIVLGPFMSIILQYSLSRNREYLADATAVSFTRNPQGLISALLKISESPAMQKANAQSATLYIADPFKKVERDSLFSTRPTTKNRIHRLENM
ncbi:MULTISPECIES: zinc metalloprotease HtpX [unclassified Granulicatella]|uniref:zinc metalloprotease HtpX n=1 Tax=unclassified Granulicatella TaxID=2630493 RepID=UPI001072F4C7|nr:MULTISPECIES: zinc metalloprotease HtpX [unclassified Granulicatella]MBF0779615.1 zinc metalloprotease HtpX [Granulicatella sp. 19428wC4_WM01]TFU96414.1 zinc metalloprotease HtpX [Granulicatella sp. WM01]